MIGNARADKLVQPDGQQRIDHSVTTFQWLRKQSACPVLQLPVVTQHPETKQPQQRAIIMCDPTLILDERGIQRLAT